MGRLKQRFLCDACGAEQLRWEGKCGACGAWNSLKAFTVEKGHTERPGGMEAAGGDGPVLLAQVVMGEDARLLVGMVELDRVLGGGLVPGSVILIGGDPGIGKSTLLLEALARLSTRNRVLYASGEESLVQIKLRAQRMRLVEDFLWVAMNNRLEGVLQAVAAKEPTVLVVDSIQTLASDAYPAAAGTVVQVRECAARLIMEAKQRGMAVFLVGHVTKEGQIAGPRILEHMVDTVLYFEGERGHNYRILRAVKNRFGAANEIGVFEMRDSGLHEVPNPSELFLSERKRGAAGSVVFPGVEGSRPVLVEIQSLVAPSSLAMPRRTTLGLDANRLAMLTAVLEKRLGLGLFNHDIFLNVTGGFRVTEPAADLAAAASLYASHRNLGIDPGLVIMGEMGLAGEIRTVGHAATRIKEAAKLGFTRCILPTKCRNNLPDNLPMTLDGVDTVEEAMERLDL
ncbi:MAG: DNA repair protein RadA [Magnetococcales bacterium]|nr:DNA repair protein RadA [Magnetococcales bacterium]